MKPEDLRPWEVLKTAKVYSARPWMEVSLQTVRLPDGRVVDDYHHLYLPDYVVIFAQTPDETVLITRQYRQGVGRVNLMMPAGLLEPGEDALSCAKRELLEETGCEADDWQALGSFVHNANCGGGKVHYFKCRNAREVTPPDSGDLEETQILRLTLDELREAFHRGEMEVLGAVAGLALAINPWFPARPA
jgi:ADP-ribose pyrophosphatase